MRVLAALGLAAVAVVFGSYLNGLVVLLPAQRRLSASSYVEAQQANTALGTIRYRILLGTALVVELGVALAGARASATVPGAFLAAVVLVVSTVLITVRLVVPINAVVHGWDPTRPPPDWADVRERWHRLHAARTAWLGLALALQFACLVSIPA